MMVEEAILQKVNELVSGLSRDEMIWINGYISGLVNGNRHTAHENGTAPVATKKITLAYGTETGNAKKLATTLSAAGKKKGLQVKLVGLDQYKTADLARETNLFIVISTQGDGEPPLPAKKFYDFLHETTVDLSKVNYSVLALGDSSYPLFCKAGEDVDAQLARLGAKAVVPLVKADTDYEEDAAQWFDAVAQTVQSIGTQPAGIPTITPKKKGKHVYRGVVSNIINLNGRGSNKETYHIEIAADGVEYEPGDALGLLPHNSIDAVNRILEITGADGSHVLNYKGESIALGELLKTKLCISHLPERVTSKYAEATEQQLPAGRFDLLDLLTQYPVRNVVDFLRFVAHLEPNAPRLYSIASALAATEHEVHLTVAKHLFFADECEKTGLCSSYLSSLQAGDEIDFYIHKNHLFKLPEADKDIIMIGPGTGVAPFRSFMAHREAEGADGRSWLFFGDRNFENDFLYQTEWQSLIATGTLTKMNVAFSRDQPEKLYVQHKLLQHASELYEWIQDGAYIYVCGAKDPMSTDVENTLIQIIEDKKNTTTEEAAFFLNELKEAGRYLQDVY